MLLLVQFYTSDLIFLKADVGQAIAERQKFLKINLESWYNKDECSRKRDYETEFISRIFGIEVDAVNYKS